MINKFIFFFILFPVFSPAQSLYVDHMEDGILIREGNAKVLFFQVKTKSQNGQYPRANYIHPLFSLDGSELTEDFPSDHLHQRGIFWAWHQVTIGDRRVGDMWECKDIVWDIDLADTKYEDGGSISLYFNTHWRSPLWVVNGIEQPFLLERTKLKVYPRRENYRVVDIEISLQALVPDLKIGGCEDEKGYGGLSVRMKMPSDITFVSEGEVVSPITNQVEAGPWMDIYGSLATDGRKAGIVIICHPDNPMSHNKWILRKNASMQNAVYPGRYPVLVEEEKPTILSYRFIIYQGNMSENSINDLYEQMR